MIREHLIATDLLEDAVQISIAGAGGTGSQMVAGLARLNASLRALGHPGLSVILYDPDDVSEANLGRQLFSAADVGNNKAHVLVTRINAWYGSQWAAVPTRLQLDGHGGRHHIIITCVDTARARVQIGRDIAACWRQPMYWMDLGNRAADGQVVLGVPCWKDHGHAAMEYRLPTVLELFPEIVTQATTLDRDQGPSCSLAEALERQELFINQLVTTQALQLLWQLFRRGKTTWHGSFINAATGRITPLPVDPEVWRRMGYAQPKVKKEKA